MSITESRRHHFVPKLLLRPWLVAGNGDQKVLAARWWNPRSDRLVIKRKGLNAFCVQLDLLSLREHALGRDALERQFFGTIDDKGGTVRDLLVEHGTSKLTLEQRCDFARLLLSLDARRPSTVVRLRNEFRDGLVQSLDEDPEIRRAMDQLGIREQPSMYYEKSVGQSLEDRAVSNIQKLVDNPRVGGTLINARWAIRKIEPIENSLVLSDRPLIRIHGYDHNYATWVLPLGPHVAFIACNNQAILAKLMRLSSRRFSVATNQSSAAQAERFVFCSDDSHDNWLSKYLRRKAQVA